MLNSRAIALRGVGYASRVLALQGFYGVAVAEAVVVVNPAYNNLLNLFLLRKKENDIDEETMFIFTATRP